ncbi:PBP1A family penicillin-binding protein, partial [Candidatus Roizmanbacteria bacterium]|nr:PBP1A family penicillin-binding protein [Candidatus Roizmanbacteria bacterium]
TRRHIRNRKKLISSFFIVTGFVVLFIFFATIGIFAWFAKDLPNPNKIVRKEGFSTIIYDRDGKPLYDVYADENRKPISKEDIPETLKDAVIAIEDKTFYTHEGYSTAGIIRSFLKILVTGDIQGGGSTLTQQLVKNVLLSSEQTLPRKIKEFILAVQIERKYTKDEILTMYLNEAPYGGTAWGVEAASELYFGKPAKELNLTESAILAGLPQLPSVYSPYSDTPEAYIGRTEHVLRRMREDGYITREQEEAVKEELPNVEFVGRENSFDAPHFVEYVRKQLVEQFGEEMVEGGGLRVTTTLDSELQLKAEGILEEELEKVEKLKISNGSIVVLDPQTGEILTMVGSKQYAAESEEDEEFQGKFNVAVQGLRQPGSALKPLVYATAFESGYTPASLIMDVPTKFPGGNQEFYEPKNYDGKFRGPVQMRFALGNSINVTAVKTLALVGLHNFLETAYNMGLDTLEPTRENMARFGLSVALGGGEVTLLDLSQGYGVFATGGVKYEPVSILEVKDKNGKTLFKHRDTKGERVLTEEVAFLISHILSDNEARKEVFGPNSWLHIAGNTVAVKTGTTDDKRDNWTVGFTKEVVVGVWVGNNDNSPMDPLLASGVTGAAPIWNRVMREVISSGRSDGIIDAPKNVMALQIDAYGGGLPRDGQPIRSEYFIKGTEPTDIAPIYRRLKVSRNDRFRRATPEEIQKGEYEEKDVMYFEEQDPLTNERNYWQEGIDAWVRSLNNEFYIASGGVTGPDIGSSENNDDADNDEDPTPTPDDDEDDEEPTETPTPTPTP